MQEYRGEECGDDRMEFIARRAIGLLIYEPFACEPVSGVTAGLA